MNYNIIAIDDEEIIRNSLELAFEDTYNIKTFETAEEGIDEVKEHPPDLVLMDITLPNMNGIEALENIKQFAPDIPVIMITAHEDLPTVTKALNLGAVDYLIKPLNTDKIKKSLDKVLHN